MYLHGTYFKGKAGIKDPKAIHLFTKSVIFKLSFNGKCFGFKIQIT